jgi:hypothetical protein
MVRQTLTIPERWQAVGMHIGWHGDDVMSAVDVLWVVALAFPDGGGV